MHGVAGFAWMAASALKDVWTVRFCFLMRVSQGEPNALLELIFIKFYVLTELAERNFTPHISIFHVLMK